LVGGGGDGGDSLRATLYNNLLLLCWIKECPLGTAEPKHFRYILTKYYPLGGKWLRLCAFYFFSSIFPRPHIFLCCYRLLALYPPVLLPSFLVLFFCSLLFLMALLKTTVCIAPHHHFFLSFFYAATAGMTTRLAGHSI
jgi:hypothetical protein